MLTLTEIDRIHDWLPRYAAYHGGYRMGLVEQAQTVVDHKRQPPRWHWRLTVFPPSGPDQVCDYGQEPDRDAAVAAITSAWQGFIALSDMRSGSLRLMRQGDCEGDLVNFVVLAGGFRLGTIYQQRTLVSAEWVWSMSGLLPTVSSAASTREQAMGAIKAAWRNVDAQCHGDGLTPPSAEASPGQSDSSP